MRSETGRPELVLTLALNLTFSPGEKEQLLFSFRLRMTVQPIQPQVFKWGSERFSLSRGRGLG